ncbi:hypothetical protein D3C76_119490 [compost metagenome]
MKAWRWWSRHCSSICKGAFQASMKKPHLGAVFLRSTSGDQKLYLAVMVKLRGSPYTSYGLQELLLAMPW